MCPCQSVTYLRNRFRSDVWPGISLSIRKINVFFLRLIQHFVHLSVARVRLYTALDQESNRYSPRTDFRVHTTDFN